MTAFLEAYPWVPMVAIVAAVIFGALLAVRAQQPKRETLTAERFDDQGRPK